MADPDNLGIISEEQQLSSDQIHVLKVVSFVSAILSVVGVLTLIIVPLVLQRIVKRWQSKLVGARPSITGDSVDQVQAILLWLSTADLIESIAFLLNFSNDDNAGCYAQGVLIQFSGVACFIWTCTMAIELFYIVQQRAGDAGARMWWYHGVAWSVGAIIPLVLAFFGDLGQGGSNVDPEAQSARYAWCWVKPGPWTLRFFPFYFPLVLAWGFCLCVYTYILVKVYTTIKGTKLRGNNRVLLKIALYPAIFIFTWSWAIINRVQQFVHPDSPSFFLWVMHAAFGPSTGIFDAITFGLTNKVVRQNFARTFCHCGSPGDCLRCLLCCAWVPRALYTGSINEQNLLREDDDEGEGGLGDAAELDRHAKLAAASAASGKAASAGVGTGTGGTGNHGSVSVSATAAAPPPNVRTALLDKDHRKRAAERERDREQQRGGGGGGRQERRLAALASDDRDSSRGSSVGPSMGYQEDDVLEDDPSASIDKYRAATVTSGGGGHGSGAGHAYGTGSGLGSGSGASGSGGSGSGGARGSGHAGGGLGRTVSSGAVSAHLDADEDESVA